MTNVVVLHVASPHLIQITEKGLLSHLHSFVSANRISPKLEATYEVKRAPSERRNRAPCWTTLRSELQLLHHAGVCSLNNTQLSALRVVRRETLLQRYLVIERAVIDVSLTGEFVGAVGRVQIATGRNARLGRVRRVAVASRELVLLVVVITGIRAVITGNLEQSTYRFSLVFRDYAECPSKNVATV